MLLLSCTTLSFATPCRFIPALSRPKGLPHRGLMRKACGISLKAVPPKREIVAVNVTDCSMNLRRLGVRMLGISLAGTRGAPDQSG